MNGAQLHEHHTSPVVLLRHVPTPSNLDGRYMGLEDAEPIIDAASQAGLQRVRDGLAACGPYRVWSSPLRRALRTASELDATGDITVLDGLREWDLGEWQGQTHADVRARFGDWFKSGVWDPRHAPPGGETLSEVTARAAKAIAAIRRESCEGITNVCVTHNGIIRVLRHLAGELSATQIFEVEEPYFALMPLANTQQIANAPEVSRSDMR